SEEHTSELQSLTNLVCRLLLEKKNILAGGGALKPAVTLLDEIGRHLLTSILPEAFDVVSTDRAWTHAARGIVEMHATSTLRRVTPTSNVSLGCGALALPDPSTGALSSLAPQPLYISTHVPPRNLGSHPLSTDSAFFAVSSFFFKCTATHQIPPFFPTRPSSD